MTEELVVVADTLRGQVREKYREVAVAPHAECEVGLELPRAIRHLRKEAIQ